MRLSEYFLPTLKENPKEAEIASHRLMLRAGMVRQLTSGIYSWLPLGYRVLRKIEQIVREEMDRIGCIEMLMPTIQPASLWQESGRYDAYGKEMLRIQDRHDNPMLFGPTNEEAITDIFRRSVKSYKDLPLNLYHIQWKFRDEIRPRFGVMRGREFLMKDSYSFDATHEDAVLTYNRYYEAYLAIFRRLGLIAIPVRAETGAIGGNLSHEFQIIAETGESQLYYDKTFDEVREGKRQLTTDEMRTLYAAADEQHDAKKYPIEAEDLRKARGIEVGHIFNFATKYSEPMKAVVTGADGKETPVHMGSYGVGVSRLVGAIIEASHDERGIIWPESVAPFQVGLINLKPDDAACTSKCDELYGILQLMNLDVLYDDRKERPGAKFATMELIGLPWTLTIGPKGLEKGEAELKSRRAPDQSTLSGETAIEQSLRQAVAQAGLAAPY